MADVGLEQAKELREALTKAAHTMRMLRFTHSEALESEVAFRYDLAVNFLTLLHADTCRMIQEWQKTEALSITQQVGTIEHGAQVTGVRIDRLG